MVKDRLKEVDLDRVIIIQRLKDRLLTQVDAAAQLGICERQVRRLLKRVESGGFEQLAPKYSGGNRLLKEEIKVQVIAAIREKYADFGPTFAAEKLEQHEGLKVSIAYSRQLLSHHSTRKLSKNLEFSLDGHTYNFHVV